MIAVLGIGAVGGFLAARTGALCVATERTAAAIAADGLRVVHGGETSTVRPETVVRLERPVSLLVVAVKADALDAALRRVDPAAVRGAVILPLLNGLDHLRPIRAALPQSAVLAGSIGHFQAYVDEPGVVVQLSPGAVIRAASDELGPAVLETRLAPLRVPGIDVVVGGSEADVLWEKAARLAVLAGATAASGSTLGSLLADPGWLARMHAALAEACAAAAADGVALDEAGLWETIRTLPPSFTTSTARDVQAGVPSELHAIVGSVLRAAARTCVAAPELGRLLEEAEARADANAEPRAAALSDATDGSSLDP